MLRVLGSTKRLCDGLTRRDLLQVGGSTIGGLTLSSLLNSPAAQATEQARLASSFGKAKNCIVLFLYGSPSQLETYDMKPLAPVEVRGTYKPIQSSLPGLDVCELLPETAKVMDRCTVVRSVTHPYPLHGVAFAMTGVSNIDVGMELNPRDERHQPYFGSCVEYVDRQTREARPGTLQNVALPFPFSSKRSDQPFRAGPYGAYLGQSFNPVWTEFVGQGTVHVRKERDNGNFWFDGMEPYIGCSRDSHFRLAAFDSLPHMSLDRLDRRRSLLRQFDDQHRELERLADGRTLKTYQELAFSILQSTNVRDALDTRRENEAIRDRYGMTLFGQSCLAARRLIESGTRLVSVFWDEYGLAGDAWDTHFDHFNRMENQLCPGFDKAFSGLILDLEERGLLDETLVCVMSEHGRTPKINSAMGGGRDHWSQAYSALFAGGGIAKGNVVGSTDAIAGEVVERPVNPKSLLATMYHLLGINPFTELPSHPGTLNTLVPEEAEVVAEMLG